MPENQNANGEHWTRESVSILKQLGWTQRGSCNFDIECIHHVKERKGQKHGVDSFFEYYDPYYKSTQGILVESKCWEFYSITTANIKKWMKQITDCMECMQVSETIQGLTTAPIKNALLMVWANDEYDHKVFMDRLKKVGIASKKYPCNIFVASNQQILRWCSLISTLDKIKTQSTALKFIYPNVPTIGSDLIFSNQLTLTQMFSKYIFAEVEEQITDAIHGGTYPIKKLVVFCYEPATVNSLNFLYTLIKRLNFQSYPISEIYLNERETPIRQIISEFTNKRNQELKGDITRPSRVQVKYLDIFDGLQSVPDNIIHFEEA